MNYKYNVQAEGKKRKLRRIGGKVHEFPIWSNLYNGTFTKEEKAMNKVTELMKDTAIEKIMVYQIYLSTRSTSRSGRQMSSGIYYTIPREIVDYDRKEIFYWHR